jgi:hypothetical protein
MLAKPIVSGKAQLFEKYQGGTFKAKQPKRKTVAP